MAAEPALGIEQHAVDGIDGGRFGFERVVEAVVAEPVERGARVLGVARGARARSVRASSSVRGLRSAGSRVSSGGAYSASDPAARVARCDVAS